MSPTAHKPTEVDEAAGFSLVELMVVVLVIAILMAIAIPTFLASKNTASGRAAQSNLRNALTVERTYFTANGQVYPQSSSTLHSFDLGVNFQKWATSGWLATGNPVYEESDNASNAVLGALGADGKCYFLWDSGGQVGYQIQSSSSGTCASYPTSNSGWFASWNAAASSGTAAMGSVTWPTSIGSS